MHRCTTTLVLCSLAGLGAVHAEAAERHESLLYASCARVAGEYLGTLRGKVLLHEDFLGGDEALVRTSIAHQLRYLWGHYRNDAEAHAQLQLTLSAEEPQIEITSSRKLPYGRALALPYPTKEARLQLDDAYNLRAVARGQVAASDPARLVEYTARVRLAICGRDIDPPTKVRVPLPQDPWLAFWYVPAALHRPLRYHQDRAVTNPCADNDFADLPHPFYYWYDWLPTRHGPDDDGASFDCRSWLRAGDQYDFYDLTLEPLGTPTRDLSRLRAQLSGERLTATVIVGAVDHKALDLAAGYWQTQLGSARDASLPDRARAALRRFERAPVREAGTRNFLQVLDQLRTVMKISGHETRTDEDSLLVEARGSLRGSKRPIRVRFWLGLTDVFGPRPPTHWRVLRRALADDQIIVYWGHSGIGENLRLQQIERNLGLSHAIVAGELRRSPLRLVAILSCYSYMYFGQDLLAAGAERSDGAYFLFTGTEAARNEAGPLGVLGLVDLILRPENQRARVDRVPRLEDDEVWLLKEVAGTSQ
jgi:hypothetical protein